MRNNLMSIMFIVILACLSCSGERGSFVEVGVIMPLTGSVASVGIPCYNGMKLAVDEFNETSERDVRLVVEDTAADPKAAVSAFTKLSTIDDISAVLGPLTSSEALAVAPLAERHQVVMISPGASTPELSKFGDYVFRNELSDEQGGRAQAQVAHDDLDYDTIAVLYVNNDYGVGLMRVFVENFERLGGSIVMADPFQANEVDFRAQLLKARRLEPDALLVIAVDEVVTIIQQFSELGLEAEILTTPIFENDAYLDSLGVLAEGVKYIYYGTYDPTRANRSFAEAYELAFGESPTYYSALGYDAAWIMLSALRDTNFEWDRLPDSLYGLNDFVGVTGSASFDSNGDIIKPVSLKVVEGGSFVAGTAD